MTENARKTAEKSMKKTKIKTKTKTETIAGEDTYAGALRAPRAGSPACVFGFIFVLIYV